MGINIGRKSWQPPSPPHFHSLVRLALQGLGLADHRGRVYPLTVVRTFYIGSLFVAAALLLLGFRSFFFSVTVNAMLEEQMSQTNDGWLFQFDLVNREGSQATYRIHLNIDGGLYHDVATVAPNDVFTYIRKIRLSEVRSGEAQVTIYKDGHAGPVTQTVYHLRRDKQLP